MWLNEERRAKTLTADAAIKTLKRGETVERWREIGDGANALQSEAMEQGRTNKPNGRGYTQCWARLAEDVPLLRELDKASRSHAMWLSNNWDAVNGWLHTLADTMRYELNHPSAIRRRYDAAHKPPTEDEAKGPTPRQSMQDQIVRLQEEIDLLRKKDGGGLLPSASVDEVTEKMFERHNVTFVERLIPKLQERVMIEKRQDQIEAKRKRK